MSSDERTGEELDAADEGVCVSCWERMHRDFLGEGFLCRKCELARLRSELQAAKEEGERLAGCVEEKAKAIRQLVLDEVGYGKGLDGERFNSEIRAILKGER